MSRTSVALGWGRQGEEMGQVRPSHTTGSGDGGGGLEMENFIPKQEGLLGMQNQGHPPPQNSRMRGWQVRSSTSSLGVHPLYFPVRREDLNYLHKMTQPLSRPTLNSVHCLLQQVVIKKK